MAEYWRRRDAGIFLAFLPGALALILVYALFLFFPGLEPIALVPFLTAGWLCSVALFRPRSQRESKEQERRVNSSPSDA
jgi:hypothetical protein